MAGRRALWSSLAVVAVASLSPGCSSNDDGGAVCVWVVDPGMCNDVAETGYGDGTGGEPGEYDEVAACSTQDDGLSRTVYQCHGRFRASISFKTLKGDCPKLLGDPRRCEETHKFGAGVDAYAMPAVMACCDPSRVGDEELLAYGAADLVEQVCRSIPKRIGQLIRDGALGGGVGKTQAQRLVNWMTSHFNECYSALYRPTGVAGQLEPAQWLVNDGKNGDWSLLNKFTVSLELAEVTGATLPDDPTQHALCFGGSYNNSEVFEFWIPAIPDLEVDTLGQARGLVAVTRTVGRGELGPGTSSLVGRAQVVGQGECVAPRCSRIESSVDANGSWTLAELELFAAGPVVVGGEQLQVSIDRAALRLYGISRGAPRVEDSTGAYVIGPGEAEFVISGDAGMEVGVRSAHNRSAIVGHRSGTGWTIESFVVEVDEELRASGEVWSLTIPPTVWEDHAR